MIVQITTHWTPKAQIVITRANGSERKYKFSIKNNLNLVRLSDKWKVNQLANGCCATLLSNNAATRI